MEKQGQGAIEYLLIVGAAIIVVALVFLMMSGILTNTNPDATAAIDSTNAGYDSLSAQLCAASPGSVGCTCAVNADCTSPNTCNTTTLKCVGS